MSRSFKLAVPSTPVQRSSAPAAPLPRRSRPPTPAPRRWTRPAALDTTWKTPIHSPWPIIGTHGDRVAGGPLQVGAPGLTGPGNVVAAQPRRPALARRAHRLAGRDVAPGRRRLHQLARRQGHRDAAAQAREQACGAPGGDRVGLGLSEASLQELGLLVEGAGLGGGHCSSGRCRSTAASCSRNEVTSRATTTKPSPSLVARTSKARPTPPPKERSSFRYGSPVSHRAALEVEHAARDVIGQHVQQRATCQPLRRVAGDCPCRPDGVFPAESPRTVPRHRRWW